MEHFVRPSLLLSFATQKWQEVAVWLVKELQLQKAMGIGQCEMFLRH